MKKLIFGLALCFISQAGIAGEYFEPARGTELRKSLMDAIRPQAIWLLGAPVQFVVKDLRVSNDIAFASLDAQRTGGKPIDIAQTPMVKRGEEDAEYFAGPYFHVLYQKSRKTWVAVHWSIGATDVWFGTPDYCAVFQTVIPDYCG